MQHVRVPAEYEFCRSTCAVQSMDANLVQYSAVCVGILHCRSDRQTLPSLPSSSNLYSSIECKAQEGQKQHWETAFFSMFKCIVDE